MPPKKAQDNKPKKKVTVEDKVSTSSVIKRNAIELALIVLRSITDLWHEKRKYTATASTTPRTRLSSSI